MKKLFFAVVAMVALLTSCSKDDAVIGVSKSKVTFTINSPELTTRYGEGNQAKNLYYAVYDAVEGGLVRGLSKINEFEDISTGKAEVILNLVEGRTYDIIFYAENENSPYFLDWENQTLEIETPAELKSNMEEYDAFYAHVDKLTVGKDKIEETVYLKRPFAQLNILTNDKALGEAAGIEVTTTSVTVNKVYTKMNLLSDLVDTASEAEVTYDMNGAPMTEVEVNGTKYHWLSMNYLLVNDKKTVDVTFTMQDKVYKEGDGKLVRTYPAIFVERNHRTNIYGSIITNPAKFNVEIKPGFENYDHNYEADKITEVTVEDTADLIEQISTLGEDEVATPKGTYVYTFSGDIGSVMRSNTAAAITIIQKEGYNIVIDGAGYKFNGTFYIHGQSRNDGAETLLFRNINFVTSEDGVYFIDSNSTASAERYAHNVTVENCTFTASGDAENTAVAMRIRQGFNITAMSSKATGMHSLMQLYGTAGVNVYGVTVDGKNGISTGTSTNVVVKNSDIKAAGYGIRMADNSTSNNIDIILENNNIEAELPFVARYMNSDDVVDVLFNGANTLTATNKYGFQLVFTSGDDDTYSAPEGATIKLTGADEYFVYPSPIAVSTADELVEALDGNFNVKFTNSIKIDPANMSNAYGTTGINVKNGQAIDGNGYTLNIKGAGGTWDSGINTTGGLIKDITVTGSFRGIFINHNSTHSEKVVLDNVTIDGTVYTISCDQGLYQGLEASKSTFNGWTSYAETIGNVKFTDCNFGEGSGYAFCRPYAPTEFVGCNFEAGFEVDPCNAVTFKNCKLNGVAITAENLSTLVTSNIVNATVIE